MKFKGPITEDDAKYFRQRRREKAIRRKKASRSHRISGGIPSDSSSNLDEDKVEHIDSMDVDNPSDDEDNDILDWCSHINTFDVCLTTYGVLQQDLTVARPPLLRPRRETASYTNVEKPRSPLVMCEWYRVIMDEVQMAGGGKTEFRLFP
jgi:E3 ubiquitin-protein ligase SHPRH